MTLNSAQTTLSVQSTVTVSRLPAQAAPVEARLLEETLPPIERLLVLIPDCEANEPALAKAIWSRAVSNRLPVVLMGTCATVNQEPRARRRLATLAALIRDTDVSVETQIHPGLDWVEAVVSQVRTGDLVVCQAEQTVRNPFLKAQPLAALLLKKIEPPVVVISGFYPQLPPDQSAASSLLLSATPFIIFVLSSVFQFALYRVSGGTALTLLLLVSVIVEYGLIGLWNFYYNR
jgi:hypothetical protein